MDRTPTTLLEAVTYFADADRAHEYAVRLRWPNGIACPRQGCGSASVQVLAKRRKFRCKECRRDFTAKVGTIFEESPIPFTKWLPAIWLLANTKNGTSSHELGRALGVTQKTAWFMLHRIRVAMKADSFSPLAGEVEADETFVGGRTHKTKVTPTGKRVPIHGPATGKTTVFGMIERGKPSRVRAMVVPDHKRASLLPHIQQNVLPGSVLYTDALRSYRNIGPEYRHEFIDHMVTYVEGRVHTNTIENFWSCLKRTLHGTYIAPRAFHLGAYVDEQVFRFNERKDNDGGRFAKVLKATDGHRLTYAQLTASHTVWRLRPGRVARGIARRAAMQAAPIQGTSDRT
ncbi:MAG TPA: IS1595 family transposase [Candidatus Sulfotelmatobacter sp.]|nr:IS1595 family transposase [Candidatus Sulfotelmatobacter sp.]